jgi:hypothetical protein
MKTDFLRKALASAAVLALLAAPIDAQAGGVPSLPSSPQYSEASQIIPTLNALINQLNGLPSGQGGYAAQQNGNVSLGQFCSNGTAGASPQVCNGQRGAVLFTGITPTTTGSTQTLTITDSNITASSVCKAYFTTAFTAGSAMEAGPVVASAGSLAVNIVNAGTTSNAVTTGTLGFDCVN